MRKIISILLALGVILGLSLMAAPVAAAPCVCPTTMGTFDVVDGLGPPDFCAGGVSDYELGLVTPFTLPLTLTAGTDSLSVDFPTGTDLTSVVYTGVFVDGFVLDGATKLTGNTAGSTRLEFVIPIALLNLMFMGSTHSIEVNGVVNPPAGTYCLYVDYKLACCPAVQFACKTYTVSPATKVVDFHFDFDDTYLGIAEDFIPPFKACGQEDYGHPEAVGWVTDFDLILRDENGGCNDPCGALLPSAFWFQVTKCPAGETITLDIAGAVGTPFTLDATDITTPVTKYSLMAIWAGWPPPDVSWQCYIHFSSPGDYEIKFFLQCPSVGCPTCGGPTIVADAVLAAKAYQWKDAFKVPLEPKWNLVSIPLFPFNTSIEYTLTSMERIDQLQSVWYFGQCENAAADLGVWHTEVYNATSGAFTGDVDNIVAGKAYWLRMLHPGDAGYDPLAGWPLGFWVWGTHAPMPPANPMGYFDVCDGWNMVGFKAPWAGAPLAPISELDNTYLWNFNLVLGGVHYGLVYDYVEALQDWTYWVPGTLNMLPGEGYWIPFDGNDQIYPKP